jgi:hypothetical protein
MYAFIVVIMFLAYGLLLLFGLLHVAQELITRPSPHLFSFSDFDADQDNELPGATESSSAAAAPDCAPSFPEPQRTLPGCQRIQKDVQPQRHEFPIRVHRENGDLR